MPPAERPLSSRHAVALGLLHGPAELLPISSSAHTALVPWLAGWPYAALEDPLQKSFEVALHAGTGLALALAMRGELLGEDARLDGREALVLALAIAPAALAGCLLRGPIERRLGGPRSIAFGLAAGASAMALADRDGGRGRTQAGATDGLALGIAQACALVPGVSRSGATLAAARARGFDRTAAQELSWAAGLPVLLGAGALEGARIARGGLDRELRRPFVLAAAAAFLSTLASARLLGRRGRALLPYSIYRVLLAALVTVRARRAGGRPA